MEPLRIHTERLELISATIEIARAEIEDMTKFSKLLRAEIPANWPPELVDRETQLFILTYLQTHAMVEGWCNWYFVLTEPVRTVIGEGGFKAKPTEEGLVEIGYSILEQYRNQGYATEVVSGLAKWAFNHPEVKCVTAETFPNLKASIRVLEKNGFVQSGPGPDEDSILFTLSRRKAKQLSQVP